MTNEERQLAVSRLRAAIEEAYTQADILGLGNIFYNEGFVEFFLAEDMGHRWNPKTQGPDAFLSTGHPTEYKVRQSPDGNFQFHWLSEKKMGRLDEMEWVYFATRNRTEFTEVYCIAMDRLMPLLTESSTPVGGSGHRSFSLQQLLDLGAVRVR